MNSASQTPIAVVGLSCRLPGNCNSPQEFRQFLLDGEVADTLPPYTRFSLDGHYDGTMRPWTMRSPGGMFINVDPQQRQLLEAVYEGLENARLSMEEIKSKTFGCFVGSYASGLFAYLDTLESYGLLMGLIRLQRHSGQGS